MAEWELQSTDSMSLKTTTTTRVVKAVKKAIGKEVQAIIDRNTRVDDKQAKREGMLKRAVGQLSKWFED